MARHIHAPRFLVLWSGYLSMHAVSFDQYEAVGISLVGAKLDVSPLQGNEFAFAKPSPQRGQKEGIPHPANLDDGSEEGFRFLTRHCAGLVRRLLALDKL